MSESLIEVAENQQEEKPAEGGNEQQQSEILDKYTTKEPDEGSDEGDVENIDEEPRGYIKGKYKTPEELETAYEGLRKKLGEMGGGEDAPESYEVQLPEDDIFKGVDIPEDDPMIASFTEVAKSMNLSQKDFNALVAMKVKSDIESLPNPEEEIKSLGPNAIDTINGMNAFYKSKLSDESYETLAGAASTASMIKLFDEIRGLSSSVKIPPTPGTGESSITEAEANKALSEAIAAEKSYAPNAGELRKKATKMFEQLNP